MSAPASRHKPGSSSSFEAHREWISGLRSKQQQPRPSSLADAIAFHLGATHGDVAASEELLSSVPSDDQPMGFGSAVWEVDTSLEVNDEDLVWRGLGAIIYGGGTGTPVCNETTRIEEWSSHLPPLVCRQTAFATHPL